ncbi:MAG: glycosyltransferase family 4 protein [Azonexus sp.]
MSKPEGKVVLMLGTDFGSMGGMSAVINVYLRSGFLDKWKILYVPTHRDGSRWLKLRTAFGAWWRVLILAVRGRVAGAHIHVAAGASFWRKSLIVLPLFLLRVPVIFHIHDGEFSDFYRSQCGVIARYFVRNILERSYVIALSSSWVNELKGIAPRAVVVCIQNPVELTPVIDRDGRNMDSITVLFLGRLSKEKGVFDLLESFAAIQNTSVKWKLILAGNGDLLGVRQLADDLGVSAMVELTGWVGSEKKAELLNKADMLVLPSYFEGLPMAVLEGMASGLPVVSSRVGGIPDVVQDSVNGLLFAPGDIKALSCCFEMLGADLSFARKLGRVARLCAENDFSVQVVIERLEKLYQDVGFKKN